MTVEIEKSHNFQDFLIGLHYLANGQWNHISINGLFIMQVFILIAVEALNVMEQEI